MDYAKAVGCAGYDFAALEKHWQGYWEAAGTFGAPTGDGRAPYYILDMFPYPSGAGLHAGHAENFTGTDVLGRFKRAQGRNVLHPMGWDAFGLPAEQYAVKTGVHPAETTRVNTDNFRRQMKALGLGIDWSREINTTDPDYVRWTQWIFLQLFKKGLAYVDERPVNWCPALGTVLANEEVIDGKSEVGGHPVERRALRQWVLRITAYADRLLDGLADVDWPHSTKSKQMHWIGRSTGAQVFFAVKGHDARIEVFTTRPDTLHGATYMVLAPEHVLVDSLTTPEHAEAVAAYRTQAAAKSDLARTELSKEKTGVPTGAFAINPVNGKEIPIWVADYVLGGYGTGAIMAVPAHDERDYAFAQAFGLEIVPVVRPDEATEPTLPFEGDGIAYNSGSLDGLTTEQAKERIIEELSGAHQGQAMVQYRLRDWLFSRQRFWGEPFPVVWVDETAYKAARAAGGDVAATLPETPVQYAEGGRTWHALPIPPSQLPVTLPELADFRPSGNGESPLAKATDWISVWFNVRSGETRSASLPRPEGADWVEAQRESNTMPQWAGSCWYYLRYMDPTCAEAPASPEALQYWKAPDFYMGGTEHAVLHLLYARFWHQVLFDAGVVPTREPFPKLFHQGIILGEDGEKMSKSRGNVVNPDDFIKTHGADTFRAYLMFMGPLEDEKPWQTKGLEGPHRFLQRVWREFTGETGGLAEKVRSDAADSLPTQKLLHATIKKVTEDFENLRYNTALSQMMILLNRLIKEPVISAETARIFARLLAPIAPHIGEELWARLGGQTSVVDGGWPTYDPALLVEDEVQIGLLVNGKPRSEARVPKDASEADVVALAQNDPKVAAFLDGKTIRKVIYVPGKILNLVAT
jgi:leucyl-tRNA synthetase